MRNQLFKLSFFSFFIICILTACSPSNDTQAMDSLKGFYQSYIKESSKVPSDNAKLESLKAKHCTKQYLDKLADEELDADPFLNAQDVEEQWAENLEITADASNKNQFSVCYTVSFDNSKHCVAVSMVEEDGSWKIDNVGN
jgi:hypothetical protein